MKRMNLFCRIAPHLLDVPVGVHMYERATHCKKSKFGFVTNTVNDHAGEADLSSYRLILLDTLKVVRHFQDIL